MKKYLSGLIAAFMLAAGLVAVSGEVATAAPVASAAKKCTPTKYVQCPASKSTATKPAPVKAGKTATTKVTVKSQGNVKPKGTLTITIKGPGFSKTITVKYNGSTVSVKLPTKKKGTYKVTISFAGDNTKDSSTSTSYSAK